MTEVYLDSSLRELYDNATRTVTYWDESGALVPSTPEAPNPRPYTVAENAAADAVQAEQAKHATEATLTEQVLSEVRTIRDAIGPGDAPGGTDSLNAIINSTNNQINGNPAQYLKPALRIVRSIARAVIRIARVAVRDYSTPAVD